MQNKPNLLAPQMNISSILTKDYENETAFRLRQYKPNTNPIPEMSKMKLNFYSTKGYENETAFGLRQNKPNQTQSNPTCSELVEPISNRIRKKEILTGVDKLCQIMDNEAGIVHSPEAGR